MSTFRASVRIDDGSLHVSRPLTAPEKVGDMIDSVVYTVTDQAGGGVLSVELTVETSGESETPIGDSIAGTSSTPIPAATLDVDEDEAPEQTVEALR